MRLAIKIFAIVSPIVITIYLSAKGISALENTLIWITCGIICALASYSIVKDYRESNDTKLAEKYERYLLERQDLRACGHPQEYIDELIDNPITCKFMTSGLKYRAKYKFAKAIKEYCKCLEIPTIKESEKVGANISIGNCYNFANENDKALEYYNIALKLATDLHDKKNMLKGKAIANNNIGFIYCKQEKLDDALKYLQDGLMYSKDYGVLKYQVFSLNLIGLIYLERNEPNKAMAMAKTAYDLCGENQDELERAISLINMAFIHIYLDEIEEALNCYNETIEVYRKIGANNKIRAIEEQMDILVNRPVYEER